MAKRKRRKKPNQHQKGGNLSPDQLRDQTERQFAAGEFRQAVKGYQALYKLDPANYREPYIRIALSVIGLALDFNKYQEASRWIDALGELDAGLQVLEEPRLRLAYLQGDFAAGAALGRLWLESPDEPKRARGADLVVLGKGEESAPVCRAIQCLCNQDWNGVREALAEIGRKSPFSHWRLFLKGCAAYYQNDRETAVACFTKLPPGTVPAKKARAYSFLMAGWKGAPEDGELAEGCLYLGKPGMEKPLADAQEYWQNGKFRPALQALGRIQGFPSFQADLPGQLAYFVGVAHSVMLEDVYHSFKEALLAVAKTAKPSAKYFYYGILAKISPGETLAPESKRYWKEYLGGRKAIHGENTRLDASCHHYRALKELRVNCCMEHEEAAQANATRLLEQSMAIDPGIESVQLVLMELYQEIGDQSAANKLLDEMSARFPDSSKVLLEAGRACMQRKSYSKGLAYLLKAQEADPLDPEIQAEVRKGMFEKAIGHFKKKSDSQADKARETLDNLLASIPANPPFAESRDFYLLRWAALEDIAPAGNSRVAFAKLKEARGVPTQLREFFLALHRDIYDERLTKYPDTTRYLHFKLKGKPDPSQALDMVKLLVSLKGSGRVEGMAVWNWTKWLGAHIPNTVNRLGKKDNAIARELLVMVDKNFPQWPMVPDLVIRRCLKLDSKDPYFLSWKWEFGIEDPTKGRIAKAMEEAKARRDDEALARLAQLEQDMDAPPHPLDGSDSPFGPTEDWETEESWEDDPRDPDEPTLEELEEVFNLLKPLSFGERVKFLTANGMPENVAKKVARDVDRILEDSQDSEPAPLPNPPPSPRRKREVLEPKPTPKNKPPKASKPVVPQPEQLELPFS